MTTALDILNKLNKIDVELSAQLAIEETAGTATDLQKKQLFQGVKSDNEPITPYYKPFTILIKEQKGQPTDRVTLKDTGDFYSGISIDVKGDLFSTESSDWKNKTLQKKYGTEILGLNSDNKTEWVKSLRPVFFKQITDYLK